MAMQLPHGTWPSPITPESLATGQGALDEVRVDGPDTYWLEGRPSEGGRTALLRHDGTRTDELLPAPWDVRTRVHEYGGGGYAVQHGTVVFSHAGDDRVHRLDAGAAEPVAITPPGPWRFGGLVLHGEHVFAVREDHSHEPEPANELVRLDLHGDNTDGVGLVNDIERNAGVPLVGRDLLLIGAGGAAAGVLGPLLDTGLRRLVVANRTLAKAIVLVQRHAAPALEHHASVEAQELHTVAGDFDIVVNASASSLSGGKVPVAASVLKPGTLAIDMMYGPAAAGFLDWARAHRAVPRDGLGMLVEQAAEAFEIWRGIRPPAAQVLAELRALVDG